jgi:hypothetical protein
LEFLEQVLDLVVLFLDVDQSQGFSELLFLVLLVEQETVEIEQTVLPIPMIELPFLLCLLNLPDSVFHFPLSLTEHNT